jgi:hypothetical protein
MSLTVGYTATSTKAFTVTGTAPVKVTKTSGDDLITWNSATRQLDISAGLPIGDYPVILTASNSVGNFVFTFVLMVEERVYYIDRPATITGGNLTVQTPNVNPYLASAGDVITLTLIPDNGYVLDAIYVRDFNNPAVTVPLSGTGLTRTFTMPAHHVTIVITFRQTVGVEEAGHVLPLQAYVQDGTLYVSSPNPVSVYNITGTLIHRDDNRDVARNVSTTIPLPGRGIYIVVSGTQSMKVVY